MGRFLQIIIALVGVAITGVLQLASVRSQAQQNEHALLGLFSDSIAVARTTCDTDMTFAAEQALNRLQVLKTSEGFIGEGERSQDLEELAEYRDALNGIRATIATGCVAGSQMRLASGARYGQVLRDVLPYESAAPERGASSPAPDVQSSAPAAPMQTLEPRLSRNLELRQAEIQGQAAQQQQGQRAPTRAELADRAFYTVLASYAVTEDSTYDSGQGIANHFRDLRARIGSQARLDIFRTQSNHFAIVISADQTTRERARALVFAARSEGWSSDAFVQESRQWRQCRTPDANATVTIDALNAALRACEPPPPPDFALP